MANMGTIMAQLGLDDSRFKAGVNNVGKWSKSKFASIGVAAAGSFAASFAIGQIQKTIETTARIKELSEQSGLTTEEFQRLSYQIRQAGGSMNDVVMAGNTLDRMLAKLREGTNQTIKDFENVGLSLDEIADMSRLDIINKIQESFMKINANERGGFLDSLRRLFGDDSAKRFIAAFQEGWVEGLEKASIITDDTLNKIKEITGAFQDADDELQANMAKTVADMKNDVIQINNLMNDLEVGGTKLAAALYYATSTPFKALGLTYELMTNPNVTAKQLKEAAKSKELEKIKEEMAALFPEEKFKPEPETEEQKETVAALKNIVTMLNSGGPLRSIGGFMTGTESQILKINQSQLNVLTSINSNIKKLQTAEAAIMGG